MIEFRHVSKVYDKKTIVVDDINLKIKKGEFVVFIGPSGSGKSTVLRMMDRTERPSKGSVIIKGRDISKINGAELKRSIGHVTQHTVLHPHLTVEGNIRKAAELSGLKKQDRKYNNKWVKKLLKMVGMDPSRYMDRFPNQLSGGQQQRVGIACELAKDSDILLMDEPFSALDPATRKNLQDDIKRLHDITKKTIVLVTHDLNEAFRLGNRIILMRQGRMVQDNSPDELLKNPVNEFVREFVGWGQNYPLNNAKALTVEKVAIKAPITVSPDMGLIRARRKMQKMKVRTLVVVKEDETLIGIATARDIKRYKDRLGTVSDIVQNNIPVICEGSSAKAAFEALFLGNAGILPVIDGSNRLKGLITKSSLAEKLHQVVWDC
ncbi:MAG: betaine/proline/choline family ABC transporter ATP-binding protein [Firmicutes bacterium]|nr:betaine/proline/choline family ABC transporter ATP-binding protein [Bacillota bacterium]